MSRFPFDEYFGRYNKACVTEIALLGIDHLRTLLSAALRNRALVRFLVMIVTSPHLW